ncbi:hypothetical protein ACFYUY_05650 [Kitasatospora sp. NPDC004745]|uniref:hypothetical protein n=1 Tax=Kitasatospora sp. NPDC004745 TaxID=3364019 RepID=UPI00368C065A
MSEPVASTLVEVVPAPQNQPPTPTPAKAAQSAPPPGAVPGMPLAVAAVNALGTASAGALALGGPVGAVAFGTVAGAAALGGLARRARNRRTTGRTLPAAAARAAAGRSAAIPHASASPGRRAAGWGTLTNATAPQRRYGSPGASDGSAASYRSGLGPAGRRAAAGAAPGHRPAERQGLGPARTAGTIPPARAAGVGAASHSGRGAGQAGPTASPAAAARAGGGLRHRSASAAHTLAKATGRLPRRPSSGPRAHGDQGDPRAGRQERRLARVAGRTARRVAKGQARAERAAGIDASTGAGARPGGRRGAVGQVSPVQSTALRRSAMRHRARMAGTAAATGLVGLASAVAGNWRHKGKVSSHMRRTWQRLAARARTVRATRDAAILGTANPEDTTRAAAAAVPVPAETVNVPGQATPGAADGPDRQQPGQGPVTRPIPLGKPTVKETAMSDDTPAFSLFVAAEEMLRAARTFDPETMDGFKALVEELPAAYVLLQEVLRVLAEKSAEQLPVDPAVVEEISQGYQAMNRVVHALEEVGPTFRQAHADDLERKENPRNGLEAERKWNV